MKISLLQIKYVFSHPDSKIVKRYERCVCGLGRI